MAELCHTNGCKLEQIQFLFGHASVLTTERYLGCKQNLGHPVNDLFDLKTNVQPQESDPGPVAAQTITVKTPSAEDVNCHSEESNVSSEDVQEHLVADKEVHSSRKSDWIPTCPHNGFLTEWDGAA